MEKVKVYLEIKAEQYIPLSGSEGAAGLDLIAREDCLILPGETKLIGTGIKSAIPKGYEIQIRPRSGLSLKTDLRIANSPGTIDSDYRDEIKVICQNTFRLSDLKNYILLNPNIIGELKEYHLMDIWSFLLKESASDDQLKQQISSASAELIADLKQEKIYLDQDGCPYGTIKIKKGERFAQMILAKYFIPEFEIVADISAIGENRGGGFGSTGK